MPNWCQNNLTISGPLDILKELEEAQLSFEKLFPCPQELLDTKAPAVYNDEEKGELNTKKFGYPDWYSWQVNNWGTKWDIMLQSIDLDEETDGNGCLSAGFDTAWSPPVEGMKKIFEKYKGRGLNIEMEYFEPGCSFIGKVKANDEDGFYDEYYDYHGSDDLEVCIKELDGHALGEYELDSLREQEEERQEKEAAKKEEPGSKSEAKDNPNPSSVNKRAAAKKTVKSNAKTTAKKAVVKKAKSVKSATIKKIVKK